MEHTKGQWKIWGDNGNLISAGDSKGMIAEILNHDMPEWRRPEKEITANAHLIAAAPGLLARLEQALKYLEHPDVQTVTSNFALPGEVIIRQCKEIIAEAKGDV